MNASQAREEFQEPDLNRMSANRGKRRRAPVPPDYVFDYKDVSTLKMFLTDRGKILPMRLTRLTARQQRQLCLAIKRARNIALLPYTGT